MIKFVDYITPYYEHHKIIDSAIHEVLKGGDYIMRRQLKEFEKKFSNYVGTKYAIGMNSGTDALFLSLKAAGIGKGDEVITVSHTFVGTVNAIVHTGAKPVLVDINEHTYNMDPMKMSEAITSKTAAIIPVHLNGKLCNMKRIKEIANENNIVVIEDACQAVGAKYRHKKAGSFGLTGCFSFYPAKILGGLGDGGIVTTNNTSIANNLFFLRDHAMNRVTGEYLYHGYNSRLDNLQAAVLSAKLDLLPSFIDTRREIAAAYSILNDKYIIPFIEENYYDVFQHYIIRVRNRDKFIKYLYRNGIETMVFWPIPFHLHKGLGLKASLPITENISKEVVALPIHPELSEDEITKVIEVCRKWKNE